MKERTICNTLTKLNNQSYYTALFGTTLKPIETRFVNGSLYTFEIHSYLPPYSEITYFEGYQEVKKIKDTNLLPSPDWNLRFYMDYKGMICSPNYCEGSFSSEFNLHWQPYAMNQFKLTSNPYCFVTTTPSKFAPDLLYAIPEANWNEFIGALPLQPIVKTLDLSVHRHLWPAYNYAASTEDETLQNWRASAFNQFHFLVSLLDPVNEKYCFYGPYQPWKDVIDQGVIARGEMLYEVQKHIGQYITLHFLNKFSHCPTIWDFKSVYQDFIMPKVQSVYDFVDENILDTAKLQEFMGIIPSSKTNPQAFQNMLSDVNSIKQLSRTMLSHRLNGRILYHARSEFGLFKNKHLNNYSYCQPYFTALFNDLIYPELVRHFFEISNFDYKTYDTNSNNAMLSLYYSARATFEVILHEHVSIDKLIQFSNKWHLKRVDINSKKPEALITLQWYPLFNPQVINQVTFICITTEAELKKEGAEMYNCLGGFAHVCLLGEEHIIKANTIHGERANIRVAKEISTQEYRIVENLKYGKKTPCDEILEASQILEQCIKEGAIVNKQLGKTNNSSDKLDDITTYYPYPLYEKYCQEAVYKAYRKEVLPSFMQANDYQLMITKLSEKFDLVASVKDVLSEYQPTNHNRM